MKKDAPAPRKRSIREVAPKRDSAKILAPNANNHAHVATRFAWR